MSLMKENLDYLFGNIFDIFEEKNYARFKTEQGFEDHTIFRIELSDYITLILFKNNEDDLYYNLFDRAVFRKIGAFIPKTKGIFNQIRMTIIK